MECECIRNEYAANVPAFFTGGKTYRMEPGPGNLFTITDDTGIQRCIGPLADMEAGEARFVVGHTRSIVKNGTVPLFAYFRIAGAQK